MTINLSRSEIKSEVEKAIRGVGVDWGRAKDGGIMAAWLAAHDMVFLGSLLRILDTIDIGSVDIGSANDTFKYCALDGIILAEYVLAGQEAWAGDVAAIRFLIAGMGIATKEQGGRLALFDKTGMFAYADCGNVFLALDADTSDQHITLSCHFSKRANTTYHMLDWSDATAHEASASCWSRLSKLAFRVYVPETEEKRRSGAGAGDIDNT